MAGQGTNVLLTVLTVLTVLSHFLNFPHPARPTACAVYGMACNCVHLLRELKHLVYIVQTGGEVVIKLLFRV